MYFVDRVFLAMMDYYRGDPEQLQHLTKVHSYAALIGRQERLDAKTQLILELAALVHDIGIKPARETFGTSTARLQETLGPAEAQAMLEEIGLPSDIVERVCYLVGHHHTYTGVDGIDYRILLEADYLVNCYESAFPKEAAQASLGRVFCTGAGSRLMQTMFGLEEAETV